jgi:hypothetical protein
LALLDAAGIAEAATPALADAPTPAPAFDVGLEHDPQTTHAASAKSFEQRQGARIAFRVGT